jgi:15-cis-phytoene synthase/lycopene beta-cyclase
MGHALQLVNIARDVKKDALNNRVYVPLSSFPDTTTLHSFLDLTRNPTPDQPPPSPSPYILDLVEHAFELREKTAPYMNLLPREAKGGLRAMVASYFEIAEEIMRRNGEVEMTGVRVSRKRRLRAAAGAMWGFT